MSDDEIHYKVMRLVEANSRVSQREVARTLGVSVGKVNYCVRALVDRGFIKARNFKNSDNKVAYVYLMTPRGIREKARLAIRFLGIKMREYELLRADIERMREDAHGNQRRPGQ
jgi:EPS-associated MarR family transcriptional regulator